MTTIINLFGQPGSGKSTAAASLFCEMKKLHYNVELVTEYAKDMVWEERNNIFQDQLYIFAKQNRRLLRLIDKVDYIITDSPIIMGIAYMSESSFSKSLETLITQVFNSYNNINIFLNRVHDYQTIGRYQTENEADDLSNTIKNILNNNSIHFVESKSSNITIQLILDQLKKY